LSSTVTVAVVTRWINASMATGFLEPQKPRIVSNRGRHHKRSQ